LAKLGYAVTIFESQSRAGGLLVNGIPSFKLEKNIVERHFDLLRRRGVTVRCGVTVGRDIPLSVLREKFDAIYLAIGAQKPKELDIPGADLNGVFHALPFLIQKNLQMPDGPTIDVRGKRVAVGGGDTAWIVCARRFAPAREKRSVFIAAISKTCRAAGAST
jgi:glutamate synthase (NADPH/NADH) small chain